MRRFMCSIFAICNLLIAATGYAQTHDAIRLMDGNGNRITSSYGRLDVGVTTITTLTGITNPVAVTGSFWQLTQPVSIAAMPSTPVTGAFYQATQPVSGTFWPVTQPVSGTFWQATQPVSGTFFQATQPVSIASMPSTPVTGSFWQATQPVSGSFFQATQPVSIASMPSTPVTGSFWQATQPVSGTFWQATQPVSGTVSITANGAINNAQVSGTAIDVNSGNKSAGTQRVVLATDQPALTNALKVDGSAVTQPVSGTFWQATQPVSIASMPSTAVTGTFWQATQPVSGTFWQATQPISGTVTTTPPANASGNVTQLAGTATDVNSGTKSAGTLRVVIATDQPALTNKLLVTPDSVALPANQSVNLSQVGGTNAVNGGLAGALAIGGTAATNAAITQNPVLTGCEALSSQPAAATTGNQRRCVSSLDGALYTRQGGPIIFSCNLTNIGTTLTECQAAPGAGLSLYITDILAISNTATAGLHTLRFGTGANCGTGTGNLFFASASALLTSPANNNATGPSRTNYTTPIKVTAANAICLLGVVTNTTNIQVNGFTAP